MRLRLTLVLAGVVVIATALIGVLALGSGGANAQVRKGPQVIKEFSHNVSPPLRTIAGRPSSGEVNEAEKPFRRTLPTGQPNALHAPVQGPVATLKMPATSNTFDGVGNGFSGPNGTMTVHSVPPDTNGAVGPHDYIQMVNTDFAIFNKDPNLGAVGAVRYGPVAINTLFSGVGGLCQADNDGDPTVSYDQMADRWVIQQFAVSGATTTFYDCVAISTTGDPTGTWVRYVWSFGNFPDYPKMSVWPDGYYITYNLFNGTTSAFVGAETCALNRAQMIAGVTANGQCFTTDVTHFSLLPANLDGAVPPPVGAPNYQLELLNTTTLDFYKFHVDWANSTNTTLTETNLSVPSYSPACDSSGTCVPQSDTTQQLDSLGDRLMYRLAYRNFGGYESLVTDHSITAGSSVGMRWYEIRSPGTTPTLFQSGTLAPDATYRWMGSIAQDHMGNMAMGYSVSSSSIHPGISYTGRLATDPVGTMPQGEANTVVGSGSQLPYAPNAAAGSRWGDYSSMTVDPADDCTFWYTNEYLPADGVFNWKTRIVSFTYPGCTNAPPPTPGPTSTPTPPPTPAPTATPTPPPPPNGATTWYFAEGYTGGSFTEYLTLANANSVAANVSVQYLLGSGAPVTKTYVVSANSRRTLTINNEIGNGQNVSMVVTSDQPIVAERPMYFTYTGLPGYTIPGGTDVLGATSLGTQYDFGYIDTSTGHDTWLTMLNQQSTATTIHAQLFPAAGGAPVTQDFSAPANSRYTVHVNTDVPGLGAGSYSALISLSQPGFVERPMYFKDTGTGYTGSADVIGTGAPRSAWYFAEGYTSSTFHERYVVSNPNSTGTASATLAFLKGDGTTQSTGPLTLSPGQQQVVDANLILGSGGVNNSAVVTSTGATILAERVMSFDYTGPVGTVGSSNIQGASDVLGTGAPGQTFLFAEGYSGGQFGEWLTLENPSPTLSTTVTVRYLPDNGSTPTVRQYVVGPTTRFTVFTNSEMPNQSFSMAVTSTLPIVAERPMYFNYQGSQQGGSDVIGYQP